jgi:VWFA-related protein
MRLVAVIAYATLTIRLMAQPTAQVRADIRVDVGLVTVACSVNDRNGSPVKNLQREDFVLRDNGKGQPIEYFWQESDLPLTLGLIVDVSGSQSAFVESHRETMERFLSQVMGPEDRAFLVTVASDSKLVTDLTGSIAELRRGVERIGRDGSGQQFGEPCLGGCGGTALWNGVYAAARQKMRWVQARRKALIVLSDGLDTGSPHSLADAIDSAQEAETVVYAIKYVDPRVPSGVSRASERRNRGLERLTDNTGGYTFPDPQDRLAEVFAKIEGHLRSLYLLGFTPPEDARNGRFHKLDVKVTRRDLTVRARDGYYAQSRR